MLRSLSIEPPFVLLWTTHAIALVHDPSEAPSGSCQARNEAAMVSSNQSDNDLQEKASTMIPGITLTSQSPLEPVSFVSKTLAVSSRYPLTRSRLMPHLGRTRLFRLHFREHFRLRLNMSHDRSELRPQYSTTTEANLTLGCILPRIPQHRPHREVVPLLPRQVGSRCQCKLMKASMRTLRHSNQNILVHHKSSTNELFQGPGAQFRCYFALDLRCVTPHSPTLAVLTQQP